MITSLRRSAVPLTSIDHRFSSMNRTWPLISVCLALSMFSIWAVFAGIAYVTYVSAWQESSLLAKDVDLLLEQGIARDIDLYDLALKGLDENAADPRIMSLPPDIRRLTLFDQSTNASGMGAMLVIDKNGDLVAQSKSSVTPPVNIADRAYFIAQRDGTAGTQPLISHPLISRISQASSIILSRPRRSPTGAFDGIVCGAMKIDYLVAVFRSVPLPPGSTIALVHRDGTILARMPEFGMQGDRRAPVLFEAIQHGQEGPLLIRSLVVDVERLLAYHQVGTLPIYLSVGLSTKEFLGKWRWRLAIVGMTFLGLSAIILCLGIMLARELNRRTAAERRLSELAATDGLTLLANRRRFDEVSQLEWRRAIRESMPLAVLMIDGDFFKAFNDTYGHVEGDQALRRIAETLRRSVERPGDLVARFGGEEFVVLLPGTDREGALRVADAIKSAIVDLAVPHAGSPLGILTVSIGVASRWPRVHETVAGLIAAADAALYLAKAEGRDRIVLDQGIETRRIA